MSKQKFVIYRRLSKKVQGATQHGMSSQTDQINFYLDTLDDYEVLGDFSEYISGAADNRPELQKALDLCKEKDAILLVAKLDRLSRRVAVVATYMEQGVKFRVSTIPKADNFQLHLYSALGEQERESIRNRVRAGLAAAKKRGVLLGAASPIYKANKIAGKHKPHVSSGNQQAAVNRVIHLKQTLVSCISSHKNVANKAPTLRELAKNLTDMGTPLPSGREGSWQPIQVSRVMTKLSLTM